MKTVPWTAEGGDQELNELEGDWEGPSAPSLLDGAGSTSRDYTYAPPPQSAGQQGASGHAPKPPDRDKGGSGTSAPGWSLLLSLVPAPLRAYIAPLAFYESDSSLPTRERLFHHWWLRRRIPLSRALTLIFIQFTAPTAGLYAWVSSSYSVRL